MDVYDFMMMDFDKMSISDDDFAIEIDGQMIQKIASMQRQKREREKREVYEEQYENMSVLDIYSSGMLSKQREKIIKEIKQMEASDEDIKWTIHPMLTEEESVTRKKCGWK